MLSRSPPQQQACSPPRLRQHCSSLWLQSCVFPGCTHSGTVKPLSRRLITGSPSGTLSPGTDTATTSLASAWAAQVSLPQSCPFLIVSGKGSVPPSPQLLTSASTFAQQPHLTSLSDL